MHADNLHSTHLPADISGPFLATLDALAWAIDSDGLVAHEAAATDVARVAAGSAASSTLVSVLADHAAPVAARERAFGLLAVQLNRLAAGPAATGSPLDAGDWVLAS